MRITQLELVNFRNYSSACISLAPGLNLVTGANGQGKSNLLEAISILSVGKSYRGAADSDMIQWDAESATVSCEIEDASAYRIGMTLQVGNRKHITVDGAHVPVLSDLLGILKTVHLSPEVIDDQFRSVAGRRRMLDMLISQADREYLHALKRHRQILQNLNVLLKTDRQDDTEIAVWELQLAREATRVSSRRQEILDDLESLMRSYFAELFEDRVISLKMHCSLPMHGDDPVAEASEALKAARPRARRNGFVSKGAHRDRLDILLDGRPMDIYSSQGQTKGAYFAWKFAESDILRQMTGAEPIWLVDDPFSELDSQRSLKLLEEFSTKHQVILTTARDSDLDLDKRGFTRWSVQNGTIEQTA